MDYFLTRASSSYIALTVIFSMRSVAYFIQHGAVVSSYIPGHKQNIALSRWRNVLFKVAVLRNSRREAGSAQHAIFGGAIFSVAGERFICLLFLAVGEQNEIESTFLVRRR